MHNMNYKTCRVLALAMLFLAMSCGRRDFPFTESSARFFDLETGKELSPRKAANSAGIWGEMQLDIFDSRQSVSFVRVLPGTYGFDILCAEGENADSTSAICLRNNVVAGINGSYFNMRDFTPCTYVKDDGFEVGSTSPGEFFRTNGAFLNGVIGFDINAADTTAFLPEGDLRWEVLASGPILMDDGEVFTYTEGIPGWESFYAYRHPRSLIGTDADGLFWLVVVDGRAPGMADGMTIEELTVLCEMLGFTDALNLDGGGSSTLWTREGGVLNHPSDNTLFDHEGQRKVPNVLAVRKGY